LANRERGAVVAVGEEEGEGEGEGSGVSDSVEDNEVEGSNEGREEKDTEKESESDSGGEARSGSDGGGSLWWCRVGVGGGSEGWVGARSEVGRREEEE